MGCGFAELAITDGTISIDLLAGNKGRTGFSLVRYTPGRPQLKNGGVWADSPLAVGRQLVAAMQTNTSDAMTLSCAGNSQEEIIKFFEDFDRMLEKAQAYWTTTWQQTPVYLRARAMGETATKYTLIHYAKYDEYFNPYGEQFAGPGFKLATEEFILGVERGLWLDDKPGEYTPVALTTAGSGAEQTGYEYSTSEGVVVGNMHNNAVLTHVFQFTASGSVFSANLLEEPLPYTLLGATMAVGNILYLGADLPFYGVKFQLAVLAGTATIVWEYWNGSTWTGAPVSLPAFSFQSATPEHLLLSAASLVAWAKTTVNGRNKYWIRARVSAVTNNTSPQQGTRHIYSAAINYAEVDADEVRGTQDALLRASTQTDLIATNSPYSTIVALRGYDRGPDFQSHINVGGGNPAGFSVALGLSPGVTLNTGVGSSPGTETISASNTNGNGTMAEAAYFSFAGAALPSFFGRFRLFARLFSTTSITPLSQLRYFIQPIGTLGDDVYVEGEVKNAPTTSSNLFIAVDLGYITLPPADFLLHTDDFAGFRVTIRMAVPSGQTLTLFGIILMPADEWIAEVSTSAASTVSSTDPRFHIIDPISYPKYQRRAVFASAEPNGTVYSPMLMVTDGVPILRAGARQRFWFLSLNGAQPISDPATTIGLKFNKSQRNLSLRSDA